MKPYIPSPYRSPNKVLFHKYERFDDGVGHTATLRKVVYLDKKKIQREEVIQVIWDKV